jgi:hypothetical protein
MTVTTFELIAFEMEFNNEGKSALQGIRMEYVIYYEQSEMAWDEKPEIEQKSSKGAKEIPVLEAKANLTILSESVEIHKDSVNPVPQSGGNLRRGGAGDVHGIRVRLFLKTSDGDELMREMSAPEKLSQKKFPWIE